MEYVNWVLQMAAEYPSAKFLVFVVTAYLFAVFATPFITSVFHFLSSKTKSDLDDALLKILNNPIRYTLTIIALIVLTQIWPLPEKAPYVWLNKVLFSLLILLWVNPATRIISALLAFASKSKRSFIKRSLLPLFKNVSLVIIWSLAVYFLFAVWGISLTAWLASAGIVGIAVGFAAKDTLANLISGIFILADAPYKVGDVIRIASGEKGEVIHVGLRSTRIRTYDGIEITVPNAQMGNDLIINETGTHVDKKVRIRIPVGVSYETDIEQAEQIILNIASSMSEICDDPEPTVRLLNFGESSLDLELRIWVPEPGRVGGLKDKINRRILEEFRKANIEIPYPKRDIYIKNQA